MQVGFNNSTMLSNINQKKDAKTDDIKKLATSGDDKAVDPAVAMIAHAMMSDVLVDTEGLKNANIASSMMQIADGSLSQVSDMTVKLQELSVASNNAGLSSSEQNALKAEFSKTVESINSTINGATFNGKNLFGKDMSFSLGSSNISISLEDINTSKLDITSLDSIESFTKKLHSTMNDIGSTQNSIQSSAENIMNSMAQKTQAKPQDFSLTDAHSQELSPQRVAKLLE